MAQLAGRDNIDETAHTLCAEIEKFAQSYADMDWVIKFPTVVKDIHDRLALYATILCRAQADALANVIYINPSF